MRRLALLAALAVPLAAAASAQTTRDAALVDAVLEAAQIEPLVTAMMGSFPQTMPPGAEHVFDSGAIEDTLRARLLADGRTGELRDVLAFLESPANQTLTERGRRLMARAGDPSYALGLARRAQDQKKGALADEALVRRFVRAQGTRERTPEMMRRLILAASAAVPEMAAGLKADGGLEALMEEFDGAALDRMEDLQVATMRAAYVGLPDEALVEASEFYESAAGRYFGDVTTDAALAVMVPALVEYMAALRSEFSELATECAEWTDDGCADETERDVVEADPYPRVPGEADVFEVAEVQPELVGGLAALQGAVEYPELSRRAGVEGTVVVRFVVDEAGAVTRPEVVRSPNALLSQAALDAVRQVRFTPGTVRGRPVKVRYALPITFRLTGPLPADGAPPPDGPAPPGGDGQ